MNRRAPFLAAFLILFVTATFSSGCISNRLEGPIHDAEGPPWVAEGVAAPAALETQHRLILIGDTGLWLDDDPTLVALESWAGGVPDSTVLFLGDNLYDDGLRDDDRERGEKILAHQLAATDVRKIFIPGNHDWGMFPSDQNVKAIQNQQSFVDGWEGGTAQFLPKDGCMGPTTVEIPGAEGGKTLALVLVDPTPWINPALREACPDESEEGHIEALDAALTKHADDWVVVASHYPMVTGGPHGGLTYGVIGDAIVGLIAWRLGGLGNTYEPGYADWIAAAQPVFRKHPPVAYAAGHDHNLQVLKAGDVAGAYLVSGAGAPERVSTVTNIPETIFAHAHPGFMVLDFGTRDGAEAAVVRIVENGKAEPVFEMDLLAAP